MSSPDIVKLFDRTKELDRLRREQDVVFLKINKMHEKLQSAPEVVENPGDSSLSKLKTLYIHAKALSESEAIASDVLLSLLDSLVPRGPPGKTRRKNEVNNQRKKGMKADSDISRASLAMRSQLEACASLKGEQVAARVTPDDADKDEWFIVKVIQFDKETREFEVLDEEPGDEDEGGIQRKYKLSISAIIPFPKRNSPSILSDFPSGRHVLAVYPGTTALYKATVVDNPRKRKSDDYLLEFDGDEEEDGFLPQRTVPFHKVVRLPEGHRQ